MRYRMSYPTFATTSIGSVTVLDNSNFENARFATVSEYNHPSIPVSKDQSNLQENIELTEPRLLELLVLLF